jgi:hypothetical protein
MRRVLLTSRPASDRPKSPGCSFGALAHEWPSVTIDITKFRCSPAAICGPHLQRSKPALTLGANLAASWRDVPASHPPDGDPAEMFSKRMRGDASLGFESPRTQRG